jgi:WD40 repeat protein
MLCVAAGIAWPQAARDRYGDPLPAGAIARLGKVRFQHDADGICTALAPLPDGKRLVSVQHSKGNGKATWHLWDADGRPHFEAVLENRYVVSVAITSDGERLAFLTRPPEVRDPEGAKAEMLVEIWDLGARKQREKIPLGAGHKAAAILMPNRDTILAVVSADRVVEIRDVRKDAVVRSWKNDWARDLAASPDGRWLADCYNVWDAATGKRFEATKDRWARAPYEPRVQGGRQEGNTRIAWVDLGTLWLVDDKAERELKTGDNSRFTAAALAPDGKTVLAATDTGAIRRWDFASGEEIVDADRHHGPAGGVALSPGARFAAVADGRQAAGIRLWDVRAGKVVLEAPTGPYFDFDFAPDGTFAYVTNQQAFVLSPGAARPREFARPTHHQTYDMRFSPDGKTLYLNTADGVNRWRVADGKMLPVTDAFMKWSRGIDFSPDGKTVIIGNVCIDAVTGKKTGEVAPGADERARREDSWIASQLTSQSRLLVNHAFHSEACLLQLPTQKVLHRWQWDCEFSDRHCGNSPSNTGALAVLPHGQAAVLVPDGGRGVLLKTDNIRRRANLLQVIDLATGGVRHEFDPHQGKYVHIYLSADGRYLATTGRDGAVLIWDLYGQPSGTPPSVEDCWASLTGTAGPDVHRALCTLVQRPEDAVRFLQTKLPPAGPAPDVSIVRRLIVGLESTDFRQRQAATAELQKLHRLAGAELRLARPKASSLEAGRRIDHLLSLCETDTADQVRVRRILEALEMMQHPAGIGLLEALSRGAGGVFPTPEARAALDRIERHRVGTAPAQAQK